MSPKENKTSISIKISIKNMGISQFFVRFSSPIFFEGRSREESKPTGAKRGRFGEIEK